MKTTSNALMKQSPMTNSYNGEEKLNRFHFETKSENIKDIQSSPEIFVYPLAIKQAL